MSSETSEIQLFRTYFRDGLIPYHVVQGILQFSKSSILEDFVREELCGRYSPIVSDFIWSHLQSRSLFDGINSRRNCIQVNDLFSFLDRIEGLSQINHISYSNNSHHIYPFIEGLHEDLQLKLLVYGGPSFCLYCKDRMMFKLNAHSGEIRCASGKHSMRPLLFQTRQEYMPVVREYLMISDRVDDSNIYSICESIEDAINSRTFGLRHLW
jgi:hypothetical protein